MKNAVDNIIPFDNNYIFVGNRLAYILLEVLVVFSWLSYPMIFGNYKPVLIKGFILILLIIATTIILLSEAPGLKINYDEIPEYTVPIYLYLGYIISLTFATVILFEDENLKNLLMLFVKLVFAWLLLIFLPWRYNLKLFDIYAKLIIFLAFLSIVQLILMANGIIQPFGTFYIQTGYGQDRLYEFYGLGVTDAGYTLRFGMYQFARLQSFADEPGTFAAALMPALMWAIYKRWKVAILICIVALGLTMSFGGWLAAIFLGFLVLWKKSKKVLLLSGLLLIFILPLLYASVPDTYREAFKLYAEQRINIDEDSPKSSSFSQRFKSVLVCFELLFDQPWGYGINQSNAVSNQNIGVSYISALIDSGIFGGIMYFMTFAWLFILSIKTFLKEKNPLKCFIFTTFIAIYIMTWQRSGFDASFWGFWILIVVLKMRLVPEV